MPPRDTHSPEEEAEIKTFFLIDFKFTEINAQQSRNITHILKIPT